MTLRQRLCEYLCNKPEPEHQFTTLGHRSGRHIRNLLQIQFPNAHIRVADMDISAPTRAEFEAWLQEDNVSTRTYHPEWFDCDDFARAIRYKMFKIGQNYKTTLTVAYCEGYIQGNHPLGKEYHAYNLLIDNTDAIYIIEPQNDRIVPADESTYRTDFIQL